MDALLTVNQLPIGNGGSIPSSPTTQNYAGSNPAPQTVRLAGWYKVVSRE
jgi:hypothetical protein